MYTTFVSNTRRWYYNSRKRENVFGRLFKSVSPSRYNTIVYIYNRFCVSSFNSVTRFPSICREFGISPLSVSPFLYLIHIRKRTRKFVDYYKYFFFFFKKNIMYRTCRIHNVSDFTVFACTRNSTLILETSLIEKHERERNSIIIICS